MSPSCGCCGEWVKHLRASGFEVQTQYVDDVAAMKRRLGVPQPLWSCHTGLIGGYAIEGHVPAADIQRLLREQPSQPYSTIAFGREGSRVFARH